MTPVLSPASAAAALTALELAATVVVVHQLVRRPMRERGLPRWTVADTLLASPLFFVAAGAFFAGVNGAVAALACACASAAAWLAAAAVGAVMAVFGVRAFGKLY